MGGMISPEETGLTEQSAGVPDGAAAEQTRAARIRELNASMRYAMC
jgi:hypothetical protein